MKNRPIFSSIATRWYSDQTLDSMANRCWFLKNGPQCILQRRVLKDIS